MSSASQDKRGELTRELRQWTSLSASFFRVAAARIEMTDTDIQVMELLDRTGPSTAGQLADLTGLTTGAITRILDRLEKAKLLRRTRDPNDGRKVIVHLERGKDETGRVRSILDAAGEMWDEVASRYDDEQVDFLLEFLQYSNTRSKQKLAQLQQEVPSGEEGIFSAPLQGWESGRLVVSSGISRLMVRADEKMAELYQARCEGPLPKVTAKDGVVAIRYPRHLLGLGEKRGVAEVALSIAIPWRIVIQSGAAEVEAELSSLKLAGLEIKGGFSKIHLDLPAPSSMVPIQIMGGAPEIIVRRPAGVAARVTIQGWVSELVFDEQTQSGVGNNARLQSPDFDPTAPGFDIEIASYANMLTITHPL